MTSRRLAVSTRFSRKAETVLVGMACLFEPSRDRFGQRFRGKIFKNKGIKGYHSLFIRDDLHSITTTACS